MEATTERPALWSRPAWLALGLDWEKILYVLFFVIAVASRFYDLGARVMSHDESLHTQFSWYLFAGRGFQHSPLMHGPSLFIFTALNYFLFGDSDFSARIAPAVLGIVLALVIPWLLRPWLGRTGALAAAFMFLISPSILYHSRYIRHDIPTITFAMICFVAIIYYLERPKDKHLYWLAGGMALMYTTMETSYIYSAIFLLMLAFKFGADVLSVEWKRAEYLMPFRAAIGVANVLGLVLAGWIILERLGRMSKPSSTVMLALGGLAAVGVIAALVLAYLGAWSKVRALPSFHLLIVMGTLVLPLLSAFAMRAGCGGTVLGLTLPCYDPANGEWNYWQQNWQAVLIIVALYLAAGTVGLLWDWKRWTISFGVFYAIFVPLYSTLFTWGLGVVTGVVGGLGYWLQQQGVQRGSQPWYYYLWLWPFYEYLVIVFALIAVIYLLVRVRGTSLYDKLLIIPVIGPALAPLFAVAMPGDALRRPGEAAPAVVTVEIPEEVEDDEEEEYDDEDEEDDEYEYVDEGDDEEEEERPAAPLPKTARKRAKKQAGFSLFRRRGPAASRTPAITAPDRSAPIPALFLSFLGFFMWMSLLAYSEAGEKMPWLITHLTAPTVLLAGWFIGRLLDSIPWADVWRRGGWTVLVLGPVLLMALFRMFEMSFFGQPPFRGMSSTELANTSNWIAALIVGAGVVAVMWIYGRALRGVEVLRMAGVILFALLAVLTVRTTWRYVYINYDYALEFGVYAHGAPGTKLVMGQIDEMSRYLYGDNSIKVAYDDDVAWPFTWYLRSNQYPNAVFYGASPSKDTMDAPVVLAGDKNYGKVEPFLGQRYETFEYIFLWWPIEDYKNLTGERIGNVFTQRNATTGELEMLHALWDIWFYRDYANYGRLVNSDANYYNPGKWPVRHSFKMYVRKDVAARIWKYGAAQAVPIEELADQCEKTQKTLTPLAVIGLGQLSKPRGVAVGPDGSIAVADAGNNRVMVFTAAGEPALTLTTGGVLPIKEPWGVAYDAQGNLYVADTWNFRVVKYDAKGTFLKEWGGTAQDGAPVPGNEGKFWGPRGIAVGPDGRVYVTDTGNKRVQVFDSEGAFVGQFGQGGVIDGSMDEPVGVYVDKNSIVYVADTWNQRVDVFDGKTFAFIRSWAVTGWYGQSLDNKPYITVDLNGRVIISDPERSRLIAYTNDGKAVACWGDAGTFGYSAGLATDQDGSVFVADSTNSRVVKFPAP